MEERSSSVSEDSSSQAEEENSRDTVASDVANVPDIHHGPVIQAIQVLFGAIFLNFMEFRRGNRVVQLDPRFPPEMWSVYQRTLDGASRINNYAEAANRRIQTELGVCHPTLGNFILALKKVQHGRDQQYMQWISGRRPKDKRKKYKDADKRILKILQEYQRNERTCCTKSCYVLCPPFPSQVLRKVSFHPPPKGKSYRLRGIRCSDRKDVEVSSAKKAFGMLTVKLEPLCDDKELEYYIRRAMLNSETFIVKSESKNYLVCVWTKCASFTKTVILFAHANAVDLGVFAQLEINFQDFSREIKADVYAFDYSGYGLSTGQPSEENIYKDIRAVYEYICATRFNVKIILVGYSMGTAACVDLASHFTRKNRKQLAGVVLIAPFTSGCRLVRGKPYQKRSCCCDSFRNIDKVSRINAPTLLVHGTDDDMVSIDHILDRIRRFINLECP
ncbi:serine aminopeptidase, s33 domain-containing protein [Ditylenchus destructor]|uniref:Serine aminopeptidase, s33 domain-containing protein n=1 Tax=Ditylenchus destructor TaxID=166010 RepID=A0AAD4RB37_9BILA|nr:serine aminopeptidase, s33 domain-containing protein [Ditylenchus destructor]